MIEIAYNNLVNSMFDLSDAYYVSSVLNIRFDKFSPEELVDGMNIELEHGLVNGVTNVTNDDLISTGKIALAHLMEYPNYYNNEYGLPALERELERRLKD